jgi:hypothetical protein
MSSSDGKFYISPSVYDDYPKLDWQESQRTAVVKKMNEMSYVQAWPHRVGHGYYEKWLFADILVQLTEALSTTNLYSNFIRSLPCGEGVC